MSVMMYFLPERQELIGLKQIGELGLGYAFDGPSITSREVVNKGPEGAAGIIFAAGDGDVRYVSDRQTWEPYPGKVDDEGKPTLWYGYWTKEPPGPKYFARKEQFDGHTVKLGDGRDWLVPVARRIDGTTVLPRRTKWTPDGWTTGDLLPKYKELFSQACIFFDKIRAAGKEDGEIVSITLSYEADIAAMALAVNYRLGPAEISLLGLFNTNNQSDAALALVDWPTLKKKVLGMESLQDSVPV